MSGLGIAFSGGADPAEIVECAVTRRASPLAAAGESRRRSVLSSAVERSLTASPSVRKSP
jgi:hypothetical protein